MDEAYNIENQNEELENFIRKVPEVKPTLLLTLYALFLERLYFIRRKYFLYIPTIVISILLFTSSIIMSYRTIIDVSPNSHLDLNLNLYGQTSVFNSIIGYSEVLNEIGENYKKLVERENSLIFNTEDVSAAITQKGIENIAYYKKHMVVSSEFELRNSEIHIKVWYSQFAKFAPPISVNLATNAIAKTLVGDDCTITISNEPLPSKNKRNYSNQISEIDVTIYWVLFTATGIVFFMGVFLIFPYYVISTGYIRIQLLSIASPITYWTSALIFDYVFSAIFVTLITIIAPVITHFFHSDLFGVKELSCGFTIIWFYILNAMPLAYLFAHKKTLVSAFTVHTLMSLFIGIVPTVVVYALIDHHDDQYRITELALENFFLLICPPYGMVLTFVKFAKTYVRNYNWNVLNLEERESRCRYMCEPCCVSLHNSEECLKSHDYFFNNEYGIFWDLFKMLSSFIMYFSVLIAMYSKSHRKALNYTCEYVNYIASLLRTMPNSYSHKKSKEESSINRGIECNDNTTFEQNSIAENLRKTYGGKEVVEDVNLELKLGECFGLLGVNGSGKTTTIRRLTGDVCLDSGSIKIKDRDILSIRKTQKYFNQIGYCPQEIALNLALTVQENIKVFALLRGHEIENVNDIVDQYLKLFDLNKHADKRSSSLSGGNKRKLMTCLAFVGLPKLILLDDPMSGVDLSSRRIFWKTLALIREQKKTSFILSSQNMEECEKLCDRLALMKEGKIKLVGSLNELKEKYQKRFSVEIKINTLTDAVTDCSTFSSSTSHSTKEVRDEFKKIRDELKDLSLREYSSHSLYYYVSRHTISDMFEKMENLKYGCMSIEDYTIREMSLEDIVIINSKNVVNA